MNELDSQLRCWPRLFSGPTLQAAARESPLRAGKKEVRPVPRPAFPILR